MELFLSHVHVRDYFDSVIFVRGLRFVFIDIVVSTCRDVMKYIILRMKRVNILTPRQTADIFADGFYRGSAWMYLLYLASNSIAISSLKSWLKNTGKTRIFASSVYTLGFYLTQVTVYAYMWHYIDGLVQERRNCSLYFYIKLCCFRLISVANVIMNTINLLYELTCIILYTTMSTYRHYR